MPSFEWAGYVLQEGTFEFSLLVMAIKMAFIYLGLFLIRRIPVFSLAFYGTVKTPRQIQREKRINGN